MSKILIVASHPDDEIIVFGPALMSHLDKGDAVHLVITTTEHHSRIIRCRQLCADLGVQVQFINMPDIAEQLLDMNEMKKRMLSEVEWSDYDLIYTHDPFQGDFGNNVHHKQTAQMVLICLEDLELDNRVLHRMTDGFCADPIVFTSTAEQFRTQLDLLARYYPDQMQYLERNIYPLSNVAVFGLLDDREPAIREAVTTMTEHHLEGVNFHLFPDLWSIRNKYEQDKTVWSGDILRKYIKETYDKECRTLNVLDVGAGMFQTWEHVANTLPVHIPIHFSLVESADTYHEKLKRFGEVYSDVNQVEPEDTDGLPGFDLVSFLQCIYFFENEQIEEFIEKWDARAFYIEGAFEETHELFEKHGYKMVLSKTMPLQIGCDTKKSGMQPIVMYADTLSILMVRE